MQFSERIHTDQPRTLALVRALRGIIPDVMALHHTPGLNIALAHRGRLSWEAGFGLADMASGRPMTPDTTYRSGSLGKTYTATAVMILVDEGIVALDDPINRHLPFAVNNPLGRREITVRDLMLHRSGLGGDAALPRWMPGESLAKVVEAEYAKPVSPLMRDTVPRWANEVGAVWHYSNLGLATLGLIVEAANSERLGFSEFVQRRVMDPLGMTHSQFPPAQHADFVRADIWERASTGYVRMGGACIPTIPLVFGEYPAGGVMARPADHIRLLLAMLNRGELEGRRLLSSAVVDEMLSGAGAVTGLEDVSQGLIWRLNSWGKPHRSFDHSGGHMWGWRTQGRAWPGFNTAVMIASNQWSLPEDCRDVDQITGFVGSWLAFEPPASPAEVPTVSSATVSYVRGALLAASYRVFCGIEGAPQPKAVEHMIRETRRVSAADDDWDGEAFGRGFAAVYAIDNTVEALRRFWRSPACEVDPTALRRAYRALGGREQGLLTELLADGSGP